MDRRRRRSRRRPPPTAPRPAAADLRCGWRGGAPHHELGTYRIDHWDDATAQGAHAATTLLHDFGLADDPGPYLPYSWFSAHIHGHTLTGARHPGLADAAQTVSADPLLVAHERNGVPIAATGVDAAPLVLQWKNRLFTPDEQRSPSATH